MEIENVAEPPPPPSQPPPLPLIGRGTPAFRRTILAMFLGGFTTFAVLYCVQPLMPVFSAAFGRSPAAASLTLSLTTGALALSLLFAGSLSEAVGRRPVMGVSLTAAAALTLMAAFAGNFHLLLGLRFLAGIALAGLPSISIAYLGEEIDPRSIGLAIGLFIAGSGLGGMSGRFVAAALADIAGWRWALGLIGGVSLLAAAAFWRSLPPSRHFTALPLQWRSQWLALAGHFGDRGLLGLYAVGFLLMGSFVTVYNYIGYRLLAPPFDLSQTEVGTLYVVYLLGSIASVGSGSAADRFGRRRMLWAMVAIALIGGGLTCSSRLHLVVVGIATVTIGFFGAHSIASSWVARRAATAKAQASSLYTFSYYCGSSVMGTLGGFAWSYGGWWGVAAMVLTMQALCLVIALKLARLTPKAMS